MIRLFKTVLVIATLLSAIYFVKNIFKTDNWDLMVCRTLMEDGAQCYDNSYVSKGYKTQAECMEKGLELAKKEGFECGKNCEKDSIGLLVCDVICNKNGCNK